MRPGSPAPAAPPELELLPDKLILISLGLFCLPHRHLSVHRRPAHWQYPPTPYSPSSSTYFLDMNTCETDLELCGAWARMCQQYGLPAPWLPKECEDHTPTRAAMFTSSPRLPAVWMPYHSMIFEAAGISPVRPGP
ncbi:uncharacterized protein [Dipodomys merriami]|uniref:uncharacterized protein isoform X2 n=1 Tax=Dipodomys merriami TaxID=94247 RepID=UPI003855A0C9